MDTDTSPMILDKASIVYHVIISDKHYNRTFFEFDNAKEATEFMEQIVKHTISKIKVKIDIKENQNNG